MSDAPGRDELAVPDYDHLPLAQLGHRIRSLSADQLGDLLAHERAHGNRLPVVQLLEARAQELADGAEPSGGDPSAGLPGRGPAASPGKVTPDTETPQQVGPSHGNPTNPVPNPRTP